MSSSDIEMNAPEVLSLVETNVPDEPTPAQYKMHYYAIYVLKHLQELGIVISPDFDPFSLDIQIISDYNPTKFASFIKNKNKNKNAIVSSPKPNIVDSIVNEFYQSSESEPLKKPVKNTKKAKLNL